MTAALAYDPEIEELLRTCARDPRSSLLRVPRKTALRTFFEQDPVVSQHATGLISAERELLRTHREALAKLLREACVVKLFEQGDAPFRLTRQITATRVLPVANKPAWRRRLWRTRMQGGGPIEFADALLLDSCAEFGSFDEVTIGQLAACSLRLQPTTQARIYEAQAALFAEDAPRAMLLLDAGGAMCDPTALRALLNCNRGAALADLGQIQAARSAYRAAANVSDPPLIALVCWFEYALRCGDSSEAMLASRQLDENVPADHEIVERGALRLRWLRKTRRLCLSKRFSDEIRSRRGSFGSTCQRQIDELAA